MEGYSVEQRVRVLQAYYQNQNSLRQTFHAHDRPRARGGQPSWKGKEFNFDHYCCIQAIK